MGGSVIVAFIEIIRKKRYEWYEKCFLKFLLVFIIKCLIYDFIFNKQTNSIFTYRKSSPNQHEIYWVDILMNITLKINTGHVKVVGKC